MDSQAEETKRVHNKRVDNLGYFCTTAPLELGGASMKHSAEQVCALVLLFLGALT